MNLNQLIAAVLVISFLSCQDSSSGDAVNVNSQDTVSASTPSAEAVIFDTDMGPDYDDVGAIAMLHAFADEGSANILATIASTKYDGVAEVLDVFNTYFNRPDVPVGVPVDMLAVVTPGGPGRLSMLNPQTESG